MFRNSLVEILITLLKFRFTFLNQEPVARNLAERETHAFLLARWEHA